MLEAVTRRRQLFKTRRLLLSLLLGLVTLSGLPVDAAGSPVQSSGRVRGTIVAVSGDRRERLPGVVAVLSGPVLGDKKLETISDDQGDYSFNRLAAGDYKLTVIHPGFEKFEQRVIVAIDATIDLDIFLQPRGMSETVTVTPTDDRINTTETTVAGQLSAAKLRDAPLVNEKFQDALHFCLASRAVPTVHSTLKVPGPIKAACSFPVSMLPIRSPAMRPSIYRLKQLNPCRFFRILFLPSTADSPGR